MRVYCLILPAILTLAVTVPAVAAPMISAETCSAASQAQFFQAAEGPLNFQFVPVRGSRTPAVPVKREALRVTVLSPESSLASQQIGLVKTIDLAGLLNRQLKSSLSYVVSGVNLWISGVFDRQKNPFLSVLVDGSPVRFFNLRGLASKSQYLGIGAASHKLYLDADWFDKLDSEIILLGAGGRKEVDITLKDMFASVTASGEMLDLGGQTYHAFYYDDLSGGTRSFVFIYISSDGGINVYLIPAEKVASDQPSWFRVYNGQLIGLQQQNGSLSVFQQ